MHRLKLLFVILFWMLSISDGFSQNFVPNPSFEQYDTCPDGMTRINYAIPWTQPLPVSTSDYYNTCSTELNLVLILNEIHPKTGCAYGGIITSDISGRHEYIEIKLNPLTL